MNPVLIASFGGLCAALFWGTGNWLVSKLSKNTSPISINFAVNFYGTLLVILVLLFARVRMPSGHELLIMCIAELFITAAYIIFIKALSSGTLGIVLPLSSTYPALTLLLSIAILGAEFRTLQIVAMLGIVAGAITLAYEKNTKNIPLKVLHYESALAISAAIIWGIGFFILNFVVDKVSWQAVMGVLYIWGSILGLLLLALAERKRLSRILAASLSNKAVLIAGPLLVGGSFGFYIGSGYAHSVVIPTIISACEPLVAAFLGVIFDKEKVGVLKRVGTVIVVASIIVLNLA